MADDLSDSYVAELLRKEAADRSLKYSALGLQAFESRRRRPDVPKPNTRFLRHLVKEVDSHNTALLAKEAEEAKARLRRLREKESRVGRGEGVRDGSPARKRARRDERDDTGHRSRRDESGRDTKERSDRRDRTHRDADGNRDRRKHRSDGSLEDQEGRHRRKKDRSRSASSASSRDGSVSPGPRHRHKYRHRSRRTYSRSRSRSPHSLKREERRDRPLSKESSRAPAHRPRERDDKRSISPPKAKAKAKRSAPSDTNDLSSKISNMMRNNHTRKSKPAKASPTRLSRSSVSPAPSFSDDDIGPYLPKSKSKTSTLAPSVRVRGRGALNGTSAMDARFDPNYDPSIDVQPEEDADDWDMALEAMRDRQKWKAQGAERLRSAGFDDNFIEAWETNTTKDEARIKWNKGGREWDRGKVVDENTGEVNLKAAWAQEGRLE